MSMSGAKLLKGQAGRDPHAALMDSVYRRQRHIYDLSRKFYLFGRDRLIRDLQARPDEHIVEIGCGTARNLICIARRYPGVRLYGVDASAEMLRTAAWTVRRAGLGDRIVLVQGLAERMTPALFGRDTPFDRAIFSYSLSMIPDWQSALAAAAKAVAPHGTIDIVDFADLATLWLPAARFLAAWLRLFHVSPRKEMVATLNRTSLIRRFSLLPFRYAFLATLTPMETRNFSAAVAKHSQPERLTDFDVKSTGPNGVAPRSRPR